MSTTPKPGLYPAVPFREYHLWEAAHHSTLQLFSKSAAHAREEILHPEVPTEALEIGHATHAAVLEPDVFAREFIEGPKVARRSNADKAVWTAFEKQHADKTILDEKTAQLCADLSKSAREHPTASRMLTGKGMNEASIVWVDEATGVLCKARVDRITEYTDEAGNVWPFVLDLKTSKDASRRSFERDIHKYRYHQQAAFYLDGLQTLAPSERRWAWIACEKERPFAVACYEIEEAALEQGRDEYRKHLAEFKACKESGVWPGYADELDYLGLPPWAYRPRES